MCDFSRKLVAWMDGELPENEAAAVVRHIESCEQCRDCVAAYKQASSAFDAYCDLVLQHAVKPEFAGTRAGGGDRRPSHWMRVSSGIGAIAAAAIVTVFLMHPRHQAAQVFPARPKVSQSQDALMPSKAATQVAEVASPASLAPAAVRRAAVRVKKQRMARAGEHSSVPQQQPQAVVSQNDAGYAAQPPIQISVPAEDMFPPGAVPDGISYNAVVTFAAGVGQQRFGNSPVSTRKTGFDRGGNRP